MTFSLENSVAPSAGVRLEPIGWGGISCPQVLLAGSVMFYVGKTQGGNNHFGL